jgi:DNA-binding IclR family transcriptional regulator
VKAVHSLIDIIECLEERGGARVSEIADTLDIAPSTAHRHLSTLYNREYVVKEGDRYLISSRFLKIGQGVRNRQDIYTMAGKVVEDIADETEERTQFLIEEHYKAVYLYIARGSRAVKTTPGVGRSIPLHVGSAGKTFLAYLPEHRFEEYLSISEFEQFTENTITDPEKLRNEVEKIRDRGYAYNDQEFIDGLRTISVPVNGADNRIVGAITIAGPTRRMEGQRYREELPNLLLGTVNELELNAFHGTGIP